MAIENLDRAISQIYSDVHDKKLVLPRFQRGFVWPRDKQANLIASFLVNLPFGSLLCLSGNKGDFITRELCYTEIIGDANDSVDYILDGQQRLSTLRSVIYDLFADAGLDDWEKTWSRLYPSLRTRWFLRVKPDQEEEDLFGYKDLKFKSFNIYTDSDIKDFIESKAIHKKDKGEYYHPAKDLEIQQLLPKERAAEKKSKIDYFARHSIIPLYEVALGDAGIHSKVIEKIASERTELLQSELKELGVTADNIYKFFQGFGEIESIESAEDFLYEDEENLEERLTSLWLDLKATWIQNFKFELSKLVDRKTPIIKLDKSETNRAIAIFEAINKGGIGLSVFDLVVAKAASKHGSDLVTEVAEQLTTKLDVNNLKPSFAIDGWSPEQMIVLDSREPTKQFKEWFVNVLSLHIYTRVNKVELKGPDTIKREKVLSLEADSINNHSSLATKGISRALSFLNIRCGIIRAEDVAFKLLVVVLAYFLADDEIWGDSGKLNKLEYWYWVSVFSGEYTYRQNERCIEDIKLLIDFLGGEKNPFEKRTSKILNFNGCNKDILTRTDIDENDDIESSSIRNVMLQFVLSNSPYDFTSKKSSRLHPWQLSSDNTKVEIHHIVPLTGATKIEQSTKEIRKNPRHQLNSMLNMTYISRHANQAIKDRAAKDYLNQLDAMTVNSHKVDFAKIKSTDTPAGIQDFLESRYVMLHSSILTHLSTLVA